MGSGLIYAAIVAIWGLLLVPMWMRKHETDIKISEVAKFTTAMETLKDAPLPEPRRTPTVQAKRAVRVGLADPDKRRRMQLRRRAFAAVALSFPVSIVGVAFFSLPTVMLLTPLFAFAIYVAWVRNDMQRRAKSRTAKPVEFAAKPVQKSAPKRSHLRESLAAIRRSATEKLLETEPELDTAVTPTWHEVETTKTWDATPTPLPAYVSAPVASVVPREIDRVYGEWNATAMLEEAQRQKKAALANLVSEVQSDDVPIAADITPTTELPRSATA